MPVSSLVNLLVLTASLALSQSPDAAKRTISFEVRGKVWEFGLGQGVPDVKVKIERYDGPALSSLAPRSAHAELTTDSSGAFSFRTEKPGRFRVTVSREGYVVAGGPLEGFMPSSEVTVDETASQQQREFQLGRPVSITGRIVDAETREAVPGIPVAAMQFGYAVGKLVLIPSGSTTSKQDGTFEFRGLIPTKYVIQLGPRMRTASDLQRSPDLAATGSQDRLLTQYSDTDRTAIDLDYATTYWPGGTQLAAAMPVEVASGADARLGDLIIHKTTKYRAQIITNGSDCAGVHSLRISLRASADPFAAFSNMVGDIPCGSSALIRGLVPGRYDLEIEAVVKGSPRTRTTAAQSFEVNRGDTAIAVPVLRGIDMLGRITADEGATLPDLSTLRLTLQPVSYGGIRHGVVPVDKNGNFKFENLGVREFRLRVQGLPPTHYIKEVRYSGLPISGSTFAINGGAIDQFLTIVLDDKPVAITGEARTRDRPSPEAHLVAAPWPTPPGDDLYSSLIYSTADAQGRFAFSGITPGTYRVIAIPSDRQRETRRPGVLERLLESGETLSLRKGQSRHITLKAVEP